MLEIRDLKRIVETPAHIKTTILTLQALTVCPGERVAVLGPSGCGKTTLLHLVAGLILPTEGGVYFDGRRVDTLSERERDEWRAENVGYIFQRLNLLDGLSILENVLLPGYFAKQHVPVDLRREGLILLERVGLRDKADVKPRRLSVGEQQRAAVARALLLRPPLILADEPTASLDEENATTVTKLLTDLCEENGSMLLLSTHDARVARYFSRRCDLCTERSAAV